MQTEQVEGVVRLEDPTPNEKVLLLLIACKQEFIDQEGVPLSVALMAEQLGVSERSVQRGLRKLEFRGYLKIENGRGGARHPAIYAVCWGQIV